MVRSATITIRDWLMPIELTVAEVNDHPMILVGIDFLKKSRIMPLSHLGSMILSKKVTCIVSLVER